MWVFLTLVWVLSVFKRDSSIMDIAYAMTCVLGAWALWWLQGADTSARTLLILAVVNLWGWRYTVYIAARNLPHVEVLPVASVDPVSLARFDHVLVTVGAVRMLEEKLA